MPASQDGPAASHRWRPWVSALSLGQSTSGGVGGGRWAVPALLPGSSPLLGEEGGVKGDPGAGALADIPVFPVHP